MTKLIKKVTITGADDTTDIGALEDLSREFPFVEWGILVSSRQEGSPRFPSRRWIAGFADAVRDREINVSMHVCGRWVRQLLLGALDWNELPDVVSVCQRVQINTHAEVHQSKTSMMDNLRRLQGKQFIFQWDGVNDHLAMAALGWGIDAAALFDTSGGAGVLPTSWPAAVAGIPCGYAGGLGPDNVVAQVAAIETVCNVPYWIDMERRVRVADDSSLDMTAVRSVLEQIAGKAP